MKRIPEKLTINGETWRVVFKQMPYHHGICVCRLRQIWIDSEQPRREQVETFFHEVMHACLPEQWSAQREEKIVERLAPRLLETLRGMRWIR